MTLPTDINLPIPENLFTPGAKYNVETYLKELIDRLSDMYQEVAQNVNGHIREWIPTVYGLTTPGTSAGITYVNQFGWLRRSGIITECWMDVSWSAHDGTGEVAILMPYEAANSNGSPFIGVIESLGSNNFGANTYLTWRVEPDTTQGSIILNGSGIPSSNLTVSGSGGFRGYIRYLGKEFED
jgi:hypothetical protein